MYQVETLIRLLASAVIAGCWWFAAIRLQKYWVLYALAAVATIGPLLSSGMVFISQMMPRGSSSIAALSHIWVALTIFDAVLFVLFASWLVRFARTAPPA